MSSDSPQSCPHCGKPLPAGGGHRLCPACLLAQALASGTALAGSAKPGAELPFPPETIADKFPQFEILECLGRGGMGAVYKARQKSLNRTVAIKILAPEREHDARFAARFAREAELLARLSHPHIVTIHDFGQADGLFYIVMEFVDGVNLRDLLHEGKVEPRQALAIVPPVCEALQYAHDHGVVHRDIKPENLLLDREGRVKIADFGIASLVGAEGEGAGTPPYMAPEQGAARPAADHRADIYALGVVLYEMLTGERPGREVVAPSRKVQIDVRLDEIVLRALEKQPEARYASATEFRTQVETVAAEGGRPGVPLPVPPSQGEARAWKPYLHTGLWLLPLLSAWYAAAIFVLPKLNEVESGRTGYPLGPLLAGMAEWSGPVLLSLGALVVLAEAGWPRWRRHRVRALAGLAFGLGLSALAGLCLMILQGGLGVSVLKRANDIRAASPRPGASGPASAEAPGAFREYAVDRTFEELAKTAGPETPERVQALAAFAILEGDAAGALGRYALDVPPVSAGTLSVTLTERGRADLRQARVLRTVIYRNDLALVIFRQPGALVNVVHGRRDGRWGIFAGADLPDTATEVEAVANFQAKAAGFLEALQTLPARPSGRIGEPGPKLADLGGTMDEAATGLTKIVASFGEEVARGFIREPGVHLIDTGGSRLEIAKGSGDRLAFTLTRVAGDSRETVALPEFIDGASWFAYAESADRVWIFDGTGQLDVLTPSGRYSAGDLGVRAFCPTEVWAAVPEQVRAKLQGGGP